MADTVIAERYQLIELLGTGGMGAVYRVNDLKNKRQIALKRLLSADEKRGLAQLFEREFHTLSELSHPRIIEVYDYGVDEAGAYYTMELLTGADLRELGSQPWQRACVILRDIASSLAILHSRRLVHCDLSPRNVRCTEDGRAKLLDFGAMMPMGRATRAVGTPPFVAPEMLNLQSLDGSTDLFGLGALAYWVLTGRHAYPARDLGDLRHRWGTAPRSPTELRPEVPLALSDLVMDCLRLDRDARPRSAGVVMERLCTIGSLPLEEHDDVAAAYLTTPVLVGRETQVATVRGQLCKLSGQDGGVFVAQGAPGSGRSRFLDACVIEAKHLGYQVIRVAAGDAGRAPYGVGRAIASQLAAIAPVAAERATSANPGVLAPLIDGQWEPEVDRHAPNRRLILTALRDFTVNASRGVRLLIAIDDADCIDEESSSLLVSLAQRTTRRPLRLGLTVDSSGEGTAALDLVRRLATTVELAPLTGEQTEALIRSLFGDAHHSVLVAHWIQSVARGNPRATMQLATHLVEEGIISYEAGAFVLPDRLDESELPGSMRAALRTRWRAFGPDAQELGAALALTDPRELPLAVYAAVAGHGDPKRTFRAIDRLVRAELLVAEGDRYRLGDVAWRAVVESELDAPRVEALHRRLATVLEQTGTVTRRAYHWMHGGQPEAAIRLMLAQYIQDPNEPPDPLQDYVPGILDLIEEAIRASEHLDIPAALKVELRMKAIGASQFVGDLERFFRLAPPLLEQLKRDSGLADLAELGHLPPAARLPEAFRRVQARFEATPEAERGLPLSDAIREVSRLCVIHSGVVALSHDWGPLEALPSLAPLASVSPAVECLQRMIDSTRLLMQGRSARARESLLALLDRLDRPDRAGLGELYHRSLRLGALYMVGLVEASMGLATAGDRVKELEREPGHRVNAQRVHMTSALLQGDVAAAAAAGRRADLVMLQDGQHQRYPGTTGRSEMTAYTLLEDLAALKAVTERLAKAAQKYPQWRVYADLGRCHHRRLQGDAAGALDALAPALEMAQPLRHREWPLVTAAHVQVLVDLGRMDEALRVGREGVALCLEEQLHPGNWQVEEALAGALLAAGDTKEAARRLESLATEMRAAGTRGLILGTVYELRARVAIAEDNEYDFVTYLAACREQYRPDDVPALASKYQRLVRDAARADMGVTRSMRPPASEPDDLTLRTLVTTAQSRLGECIDSQSRAQCVLDILADHMALKQAFLYGVKGSGVTLLSTLGDEPPPPGLDEAVARYVEHEIELNEARTTSASGDAGLDDLVARATETLEAPRLLLTSDELSPVPLLGVRDGAPIIAAIAAVRTDSKRYVPPPNQLLELLATALLSPDGEGGRVQPPS